MAAIISMDSVTRRRPPAGGKAASGATATILFFTGVRVERGEGAGSGVKDC